MKTPLLVRLLVAFGGLALLAACAASPPRPIALPGPGAPTPGVVPSTAVLNGKAGPAGVGGQLSRYLIKHFPEYGRGRMAIGWDESIVYMGRIAGAAAAQWPGAAPLSELGVEAKNEADAFSQLDPMSFAGLLWLSPDVVGNGELQSLSAVLRSTNGGPPVELLFTCSPPLLLAGGPSLPTTAGEPHRWLDLPSRVLAMGWESHGKRLWAATEKELFSLDPESGKETAKWPLPALTAGLNAGPSVLHEIPGPSGAGAMGWFDLGRQGGRLYEKNPSGRYEPTSLLEGYPLSRRISQFLSAPFDGDSSAFSLTDFRGDELGLCLDIVRFQGPKESLFAFLKPGGGLGVIQGHDLSVVSGPVSNGVSAIAASGKTLIVALKNGPNTLMGYTMSNNFVWQKVWEMKGPRQSVQSLCVGAIAGKPVLFLGTADHEKGAIYIMNLPIGRNPVRVSAARPGL